jgi:hypothetical protein
MEWAEGSNRSMKLTKERVKGGEEEKEEELKS